MTVLTLRYKRIHKKVDGDFPYQGAFELGAVQEAFESMHFRRMVARTHEILSQHPHVERVVFQRDDRPGIVPFELGPGTVQLLRTDPTAAYRAMNFNPEPSVNVTAGSLGSEFSQHVYIRVQEGKVEDPLTGAWKTLAYGHKQGWKVRGENNRSDTWLPLVALVDDAPEGVSSIERIVFARWALVDVDELLKTAATHFYLPRPWNVNGPWITREELQHLSKKNKENAS